MARLVEHRQVPREQVDELELERAVRSGDVVEPLRDSQPDAAGARARDDDV